MGQFVGLPDLKAPGRLTLITFQFDLLTIAWGELCQLLLLNIAVCGVKSKSVQTRLYGSVMLLPYLEVYSDNMEHIKHWLIYRNTDWFTEWFIAKA